METEISVPAGIVEVRGRGAGAGASFSLDDGAAGATLLLGAGAGRLAAPAPAPELTAVSIGAGVGSRFSGVGDASIVGLGDGVDCATRFSDAAGDFVADVEQPATPSEIAALNRHKLKNVFVRYLIENSLLISNATSDFCPAVQNRSEARALLMVDPGEWLSLQNEA
jgi:hypothetical protein